MTGSLDGNLDPLVGKVKEDLNPNLKWERRDPNLIEGLHHVYFYDLDSVKPRRNLEWIMDDGRTLTWEQQLVRLQSTPDADPWVVRS